MADQYSVGFQPSDDYPDLIKRLRADLGLTQKALADALGVSFATVNRWENGQTKPSQLSWSQLRQLEMTLKEGTAAFLTGAEKRSSAILDFTARPEIVKILAEGERLSFGHLMNPTFATEISRIDPLPHQRIAVYDHMVKQERLRFLLADDAGAGKTIMAGLYIREMLSRRLIRRILIVPPAGLVGNWQSELLKLFSLPFKIIVGSDTRHANPFLGEGSDCVIVSIDTLASQRVFSCLMDPHFIPYDLVIFDEAHKLAADRGADLRIRKTERYCLAEALAGVRGNDKKWQLDWSAHHLLLLTATPHMGKDFPYYALWHLLEPEVLATIDAFSEYPADQRAAHFIRRTKEEMVYLDGRPLYPKRISDTLGYNLSQGDISEQKLYDETTDYLRYVYNRAKLLNREAARLAMSVFQRRLASSTYALLRSFERRLEKLNKLIDEIQDGTLTMDAIIARQQRLRREDDVFEMKTAEDENPEEECEENETAEDRMLQGIVAASLVDLLAEREQVRSLLDLAKQVYDSGQESKFEKLREVLTDPQYSNEKFIIFTEHRDTLLFLVRRLGGMGYVDQIAQIHGGMHYTLREEEVERFRQPIAEGGARFLICTDAAGEGINLQFCWIMINYDVPWNPARLEQRMGRIHRYLQRHDPVIILNLVAPYTREGKVLKTLLDKLEKIRQELQSDKVFDCIGRFFEGVSIKQYMELAVTEDAETVARELDGRLTKQQIEALAEREKCLYGTGGDVACELPRLRADMDREVHFHLLPGYVRQYIEQAAPLVDIDIVGELDSTFSFRPTRLGAMDPLLSALEMYPEKSRDRFTLSHLAEHQDSIWLHPGEPVFEKLRSLVTDRLADQGQRGALFVDPNTEKPYLFHMALIHIVRKADPDMPDLGADELLDCRLVGVRQYDGSEISLCPVEHLLLLRGGNGIPAAAHTLAMRAGIKKEQTLAFLSERVARELAMERRQRLLNTLPERRRFMQRGFDYREAELAMARARHTEKARKGNRKAMTALEDVKQQQRQLVALREKAMVFLEREPDLITTGPVTFVAHALVVPSDDPIDRERYDINVEMVAMKISQAFEEAADAKVLDVHKPDLARKAGLPENPGFDLLSLRADNQRLAIEVKGRAGTGSIEVSANEWAKACNIRDGYWLYVVYDCATANPRLVRVQDPFGSLLANSKGSWVVSAREISQAAIP